MNNMTPDDRLKLTQNAHNAILGKKRDIKELIKRAKRREQTKQYMGQGEQALFEMLFDVGFMGIKQLAVERYNIDLGFPATNNETSVAVELLIHTGLPHTRIADRKKIKYLLESGWNVIYVRLTAVSQLCSCHIDYITTYLNLSNWDPSVKGQYRVIGRRCDLEFSANVDSMDFS